MTKRQGENMAAEIAEQPAMLAAIASQRDGIADTANAIRRRAPRFALLAARGSSDHAALYAKYLIEISLGLPTGLVSPSTFTLYQSRPDLRDVLLISISQSGGSPDLLEVTEAARGSGALTVAVSNTEGSPLNTAAELAVDIGAGTERAVAATKSYTATMLALYLLVDAVGCGNGTEAANIGELAERTLAESVNSVERAIEKYRFVERILTTGRGYSYASALEAALKLAETSYLAARAYSGADLLHGPVAAIDEETAVLAMTSVGKGGSAMKEVLRAVAERGADILALGSASPTMPAATRIDVPDISEPLAPVLEVLPMQRLALGLAIARGSDPDQPRGLRKVTKTR